MERNTLYGIFAALLVWSLFLSASATFYAYDPLVLNNSLITGLAEPSGNYDAATKNYTDSITTITCTNYSVSLTYCDSKGTSNPCYASKFTADKVCFDKGKGDETIPYAASYLYKYSNVSDADKWTGSGWSQVNSDQEDVGYGGSGRAAGSSNGDTSYITEVLCCG